MNSLSYPITALLLIIFLNIVFFSKKRVNTSETFIYKKLIIITLLECVFAVFGIILVNLIDNNIFLEFIVKIDYALIILWATIFGKYVFSISIIRENILKTINRITTIFSTLVIIFTLLLPVQLITENGIIDSKGPSTIMVFLAAAVYIILIAVFSIRIMINKNLKNNRRKIIPLFSLIIIILILLVVKTFISEIIIQNFAFSFVSLIMYFTIENPDVKMLEEMNIAKERAERANAAKTDFLSSMSHEIRTPLNAIVGFSETICEENDLEKAKTDAKDIVIAAKNLLEIVNGILDISKIEANKMEIIEKDYNPRKMFEDIAKLIKPRIEEKPIELIINIAKDLPECLYGDSGKIKQITTNILTNAAKYTEKGTINFTVSCVNLNNESSLIISVEDTGRGIKPEQINKLFTKFERLEEDRNTTLEGTGLGLAISQKLVEMMGGKIVAQSVYGSGSKFTIYIKQKISSNKLIEEIEENQDNIVNHFIDKKILIVDDNGINLKVARRLLEKYGLNIDEADSGFECINKINDKNKYDLIFMDDMMPKMSGTETLEKLKSIYDFNTPVIILTANAIDGMKNKYLEKGFDDYLSKPIDKQELERVLKRFLKNKTIIDENIKIIANVTKNNNESEMKEPESTNTKDFLEKNNIDVNHGIELLGDIDMYNSVMEDFLKEMDNRLPKLKEYKENEDMPNYAILVHAIKSDCKYLGITELANHNYEHELKSKENNIDFINSDYKNLIDDINKYLIICKKYLNK